MQRIRRGDEVIVVSGKDKGKLGKVSQIIENGKLLVDGINMVKKHQRGNPNIGSSGGIIEKSMPIHISNVALYNPKTKKADKVGFKFLEDGKKVRFFKSSNEIVNF